MQRRILAGILATLTVGTGWSEPPTQFEAVSIRESAPGTRGGGFNLSPGRLTAKNQTLNELVRFAYDLHDYQLAGNSGWTDTEHFEIVATFPAATASSERGEMMRQMLADRFALTIHREPKVAAGYSLVAGRKGPKLHDPEAAEPGVMLGRNAATGLRTLRGNSAKLSDLASILTNLLGRPVQDETGLSGLFDFSMEWAPDPAIDLSLKKGALKEGVLKEGGAQASPGDGAAGASIFTAIQEQLGLKLEGRKVQVEVFVIDHAEKPSAN